MYQKYFFFFVIFFFSSAIFAQSVKTKQGVIKDGVFFSKNPTFSIALPDFHTASLKSKCIKKGQITEFNLQDDFGRLFQLSICNLPGVATSIQNEKIREIYSAIFNEVFFPIIKATLPAATVLHQEVVTFENQTEGLFVLVDFPKGSTLVDSSTGERFNSMRGCLLRLCDNQLLILSYQEDLQFVLFSAVNSKEKGESYKQALIRSANSYKNLSKKKNAPTVAAITPPETIILKAKNSNS